MYLELPVSRVASVVSVNREVVLQMYTLMAHFPIVTFFPFFWKFVIYAQVYQWWQVREV